MLDDHRVRSAQWNNPRPTLLIQACWGRNHIHILSVEVCHPSGCLLSYSDGVHTHRGVSLAVPRRGMAPEPVTVLLTGLQDSARVAATYSKRGSGGR